jgi:hypothetical protein
MFAIRFGAEAFSEAGPDQASLYGTIVLGDHRETFISSLTYWSRAQYEEHWRSALQRVAVEGNDSCLITSLSNPSVSNMLFWWPMYRDPDIVHFQEGILLFETLDRPFDPARPFDVIPPRETVNEDGLQISEWHVPVQEIYDFGCVRNFL